MRVLVILEWDNPKDEERLKKYYGLPRADSEYMQAAMKGLCRATIWTDGTGHNVETQEFESMEDFAKLWGDDEYHRGFVRVCRTVDNASRRIMREAISVPL